MTKRVLFGGLFHETHTFLRQPTTIADFEAMALHVGHAAINRNLGNGSPTDGFLDVAMRRGWELIPTIQMAAMPSGVVEDAVIALFRQTFLPGAGKRGRIELDGIFLVLHGAMVSESSNDPEGDILARHRRCPRRCAAATSRWWACSTCTPTSRRR